MRHVAVAAYNAILWAHSAVLRQFHRRFHPQCVSHRDHSHLLRQIVSRYETHGLSPPRNRATSHRDTAHKTAPIPDNDRTGPNQIAQQHRAVSRFYTKFGQPGLGDCATVAFGYNHSGRRRRYPTRTPTTGRARPDSHTHRPSPEPRYPTSTSTDITLIPTHHRHTKEHRR